MKQWEPTSSHESCNAGRSINHKNQDSLRLDRNPLHGVFSLSTLVTIIIMERVELCGTRDQRPLDFFNNGFES